MHLLILLLFTIAWFCEPTQQEFYRGELEPRYSRRTPYRQQTEIPDPVFGIGHAGVRFGNNNKPSESDGTQSSSEFPSFFQGRRREPGRPNIGRGDGRGSEENGNDEDHFGVRGDPARSKNREDDDEEPSNHFGRDSDGDDFRRPEIHNPEEIKQRFDKEREEHEKQKKIEAEREKEKKKEKKNEEEDDEDDNHRHHHHHHPHHNHHHPRRDGHRQRHHHEESYEDREAENDSNEKKPGQEERRRHKYDRDHKEDEEDDRRGYEHEKKPIKENRLQNNNNKGRENERENEHEHEHGNEHEVEHENDKSSHKSDENQNHESHQKDHDDSSKTVPSKVVGLNMQMVAGVYPKNSKGPVIDDVSKRGGRFVDKPDEKKNTKFFRDEDDERKSREREHEHHHGKNEDGKNREHSKENEREREERAGKDSRETPKRSDSSEDAESGRRDRDDGKGEREQPPQQGAPQPPKPQIPPFPPFPKFPGFGGFQPFQPDFPTRQLGGNGGFAGGPWNEPRRLAGQQDAAQEHTGTDEERPRENGSSAADKSDSPSSASDDSRPHDDSTERRDSRPNRGQPTGEYVHQAKKEEVKEKSIENAPTDGAKKIFPTPGRFVTNIRAKKAGGLTDATTAPATTTITFYSTTTTTTTSTSTTPKPSVIILPAEPISEPTAVSSARTIIKH